MATALTTVAAVKAYRKLPVTANTEMDAALQDLIARVSVSIENYLQRTIARGPRVDVRDGTGGTAMMTRDFPVASVQAVEVDGQAIPAAGGFGRSGWRLGDGRTIVLEGYRFARGVQNIRIAYTAGFAAVPGDVEQACIETVALAWARAEHIDVSSKSLAGETISYITSELTPSAKQMLGNYRRVAPLL
jgi:hypothetical protein